MHFFNRKTIRYSQNLCVLFQLLAVVLLHNINAVFYALYVHLCDA